MGDNAFEAVTVVTKRCAGPCKRAKPIEEFALDKNGVLGRYHYCRDCHGFFRRAQAVSRAPQEKYRARKSLARSLERIAMNPLVTVQDMALLEPLARKAGLRV